MAASYIAASAWIELEADGTVAVPAGGSAGDRIFLFAAWKDYAVTCQITSPGGWTEVIEWADGTTGSGNGTGSVKVGCWYKTHDGTESTNPTMDFSADPTNSASAILIMRPGAGESFPAPGYVTAAVSSGTSGATTESSATIAVPSGGVVMAIVGIRDDSATFTRGTDSGIHDKANVVTWNGNYAEVPSSHYTDATGDDLSADLGYRLVTTGAAAQTLTAYTLLSATETGAALWVVQGTQPSDTGPAELAAGSGAAYGATVAAKSSAGLPTTATGTAYAGTPQVRPIGGLGAATGTAYAATGQVRPTAGLGAGTGTAYDASVSVKPTAGLAEATGTAFDGTVDAEEVAAHDDGPAELAEGTGTAYGATAKVTTGAGLATGWASVSHNVTRVWADGDYKTGDTVIPTTGATGFYYIVTSHGNELHHSETEPVWPLGVGQSVATESGELVWTAAVALVGATPKVKPNAALAVGTGTAAGASADIDGASGVSVATGTAYDATTTAASKPAAGLGAASGTAHDAIPKLGANTSAAAAIGSAYDATGAVGAFTGHASAVGTAYDATVTTAGGTPATLAPAGLGGAIGTAYDATILSSGTTSGGRRQPYPVKPRDDEEDDLIALFL